MTSTREGANLPLLQAKLGSKRIVVIKVSDDTNSQHLNLMNLFFAAHKQVRVLRPAKLCKEDPLRFEGVSVSAVCLGRGSGVFQQAADETGGSYHVRPLPNINILPALVGLLL